MDGYPMPRQATEKILLTTTKSPLDRLHFCIHSCHVHIHQVILHNLYYVLLKTSGVTLSAGVAQLG